MIGVALTSLWATLAAGFSVPAISQPNRAAFAESIAAYREFVTPYCAPELVRAYNRVNYERDRDFVRSLGDGHLRSVYRNAVRKKAADDERTVRHCDGPPPPPVAPGTAQMPSNKRTDAIIAEQQRLREIAAEVPRYFDAGDAAFAKMVSVRDNILARKEP